MKKIVVDKEYLKAYNSLGVVLENCDVYEIDVADILDIYCEAEVVKAEKNTYFSGDGFIKIAAKASNAIECSVLRNNEIGTEWDYRLKNRLEMCGSCADMTSFSLQDKRKRSIDIFVPYEPLEEILQGTEIELSNCPSFELDNDGNIIIAFGERSKQPRRKDNNYAELIEGWKGALGDYEPKILNVVVKSLSSFGEEETNYAVVFEICDDLCKEKRLKLMFMDCEGIAMELFFPISGECEVVMSKMANGRIYVGFQGLGMDFICASVIEYNEYCTQSDEQ